MRYTTKTEYGLVSLAHLARKTFGDSLTSKELAETEKFSPTYIEKIFQGLRAAGIVTSHAGKQGGFSLARSASQINLKEIIDALEGHTFDVFCEPEVRDNIVCTHFGGICGVRPVWARTKELLDQFYGSLTLEMIAKGEYEAKASVAGATDASAPARDLMAGGAS